MQNKFFGILSVLILFSASLLTGCSSSSRYQMANDDAPANAPDVSKVEDAHPRYEPHSRQGNKRYKVLGQTYSVMPSAKGYHAKGTASWYGAKFHGHLTSNGEIYDMYSMSAAHKTLPLPSYVRVTNLDNDKQVIVRVNDRGPFHHNRLIDLSYAAASKLGMLSTGTAPVSIEAIYVPESQFIPVSPLVMDKQHFIQLIASADKFKLQSLGQKLQQKYDYQYRLQTNKGLYKLQLGPINQSLVADKILHKLRNEGYPESYMLVEPKS